MASETGQKIVRSAVEGGPMFEGEAGPLGFVQGVRNLSACIWCYAQPTARFPPRSAGFNRREKRNPYSIANAGQGAQWVACVLTEAFVPGRRYTWWGVSDDGECASRGPMAKIYCTIGRISFVRSRMASGASGPSSENMIWWNPCWRVSSHTFAMASLQNAGSPATKIASIIASVT
jgi:hypothetical protein